MPVTDVTTDPEALTLTLTADFAAPAERVWSAFTDPRQLERFWGPPGYPATFTTFDFEVGGTARYRMTSPRGEESHGSWEFIAIDPRSSFAVLDQFANPDGSPVEGMPSSRMTFAVTATDAGARLISTTYFTSSEALEQLVGMGMVEGITMAYDQLDRVLEGLRTYAQGKGTRVEVLDDRHVRITRLIEGPRDLVWRAHTEPELMRRGLLGPDGWRMSACELEPVAGSSYRYAWEPVGDTEGEAFGFDGDVLLVEPQRRLVTTEHMTGTDHPPTLNDLGLEEEDGATLLIMDIEYTDAATRDLVLATGMVDGMEASYARLEGILETA
jgi:uncharacterized protein YndB with AHSA1/START domain